MRESYNLLLNLAEQGMFGLIFLILLYFYLPVNIILNRNSIEKAFLLSLFTLGILTSFHAGMRTFVTPFFVNKA